MLTTFLAAFVVAAPDAAPSTTPDATMLRYPDIGKSDIVFAFQGNLWLVPKEGGTARPLTTTPDVKSGPRFSPDGSKVAFVARNLNGNFIRSSGVVTVQNVSIDGYLLLDLP